MIGRWIAFATLAFAAACAGGTQQTAAVTPAGPCEPVARMPVAGRASPYDSTLATVGTGQLKVCYGRPSARGRAIFGELVPLDTLWRTGANEPTILHLSAPAEVAGVRLEPGTYSLYTVPGRDEWTVVLNRSTSQWGHESQYTAPVRAQEIARARVPAARTDSFVETFTIRTEPAADATLHLVLEWENTRVRIPVRAV